MLQRDPGLLVEVYVPSDRRTGGAGAVAAANELVARIRDAAPDELQLASGTYLPDDDLLLLVFQPAVAEGVAAVLAASDTHALRVSGCWQIQSTVPEQLP